MMKHEFEALTKRTFTEDEYFVIELVYMHHPAVGAKSQLAELFQAGGMNAMREMYSVAWEMKMLVGEFKEIEAKKNEIKSEKQRLVNEVCNNRLRVEKLLEEVAELAYELDLLDYEREIIKTNK